MVERVRLSREEDNSKTSYFTKSKPLVFIPSGSTLQDLVLGGGWPLGRISNVIGDKSVGKTQIAIEALINFLRMFEDGYAYYQEVESAFDVDYAEEMGLDYERYKKRFNLIEDVETVNDTHKLLTTFIKKVTTKGVPGLIITDSLDAVKMTRTDKNGNEKSAGLQEGYDMAKRAAQLNSLVTEFAGPIKRANSHWMIVSQVRENIGVMFGDKYRTAGGKALQFYASQRIMMSEIKKVSRTINNVKRDVAIRVRIKAKKNKVGLPYRDCEYPIVFGYGIDNATSCIEWLDKIDRLNELSEDMNMNEMISAIKSGDSKLNRRMIRVVTENWNRIETKFLPKYKKY